MKKIVIGLLTAIFFLHGDPPASAEGERNGPFEYIQAEVREWLSFGDSKWRISFFDIDRRGDGESILEFEDIDAPVTLLSLQGKPGIYWLTLEGAMGFGNIESGTTVDTDQTEGNIWSKSESDTDGDLFLLDFRVYQRITPWEEESPSYLDAFLEYTYFKEKLHITNGDQIIPPYGSFSYLNSTYEFVWQSYSLGLKGNLALNEEASPGLYNISIAGSASGGLVRYRGEGVWNLRDDFEQDPSFRHESDHGVSAFTELGFVYQPIRYISIGIGYQFLYFEAWSGTDITFFSDGTEASTRLDEVLSYRHGPYIAFSGQF